MASRAKRSKKSSNGTDQEFFVGFLVVITNPAVFLMWVGFVGFFKLISRSASAMVQEFFLTGFLIGAMLWFVLWLYLP